MTTIDNPNPEVFTKKDDCLTEEELEKRLAQERNSEVADPIDELEGSLI